MGGDNGLLGGFTNGLFGGQTNAEKQLGQYATAPYLDKRTQRFLPYPLQAGNIDPVLNAGIGGIADLIRNPGQLSPTVSSAISPQLANESQDISQQYRGIGQNQAGALARSNAPMSIKGAMQSALDIAQERAQRGARNTALTESDQLRRQDLNQTYALLNAIMSFTQPNKQLAVAGLGEQSDLAQKRQAANEAFWASVIQSVAGAGGGASGGMMMSSSRFKEAFEDVPTEEILAKVRALPLYKWRYKGDSVKHLGPMAEDFLEAFGLGGNKDAIYVVDAIGTLLAATQALSRKVEHLESEA